MKSKVIRYILFPVGVFISVFLAVAVVLIFKQDPAALIPWLFIILVNLAALYLFSSKANPRNPKEGLTYGLVWMIVIIFLDFTITSRLVGPDGTASYFASPRTWFSYAIIIFVPIDWATKLLVGRFLNK